MENMRGRPIGRFNHARHWGSHHGGVVADAEEKEHHAVGLALQNLGVSGHSERGVVHNVVDVFLGVISVGE